tara:strand:+ start:504 stop:689 length:186 start_codon:yes stop_codon:yes gene_type:complete
MFFVLLLLSLGVFGSGLACLFFARIIYIDEATDIMTKSAGIVACVSVAMMLFGVSMMALPH